MVELAGFAIGRQTADL